MALYKRGETWWCEWRVRGARIRESTGATDRQAAQEYHDRRRAAIWRETHLAEPAPVLWDAAALDWWESHAQHKRSAEDDRLRLRWVTQHLSRAPLPRIDTDLLTRLRETKRAGGAASATANRHLAVVSAVLHHAHARGWIAAVPKIPYTAEPRGRLEWLTRDEACALCCRLPLHLGAMALLTLATGLRRANVTALEWSQIDLSRRVAWIHPDQAKSGQPLAVPLNADAMAVLELQRGEHFRWVFTYRARPVRETGTKAWYAALADIGRARFPWHGLRHTWASWHVMAGTPLEVLQRLGGWASLDMVLRYAHLAPGYIAHYADRVNLASKVGGNSPTKCTQCEKSTPEKTTETSLKTVGWLTGLEPATTGITILNHRRKSK